MPGQKEKWVREVLQVGVRAWKADAQNRSRGRVSEGDGKIAKGGKGTEICEDEAEVLDCAGEVRC